jgi:hypothetical protein
MIQMEFRPAAMTYCDAGPLIPEAARVQPDTEVPKEQQTCTWHGHGRSWTDAAEAKREARKHVKDTGHGVVHDRIVRTVLQRQDGDR